MASKKLLLFAAAALLRGTAVAKTDLEGCTSSDGVATQNDGYVYATRVWFVEDTGEICEFLDCGGGRAPPKTTVPGCGSYEGTDTYSPRFLPSSTTASASAETSKDEDEDEDETATPAPSVTEAAISDSPTENAVTESSSTDSASAGPAVSESDSASDSVQSSSNVDSSAASGADESNETGTAESSSGNGDDDNDDESLAAKEMVGVKGIAWVLAGMIGPAFF